MKITKGTVVLVVAILVVGSVVVGLNLSRKVVEAEVTSKDLTPSEAYDLIAENKGNSDFVILDVRTPEEYAAGRIAGALLLDFYEGDFADELTKLNKNKTYLVYCRSGNRSSETLSIMQDAGFKTVYNMQGGMNQWLAKGLPVEH